jgi:DNA-3-methyladenine glycosylase II
VDLVVTRSSPRLTPRAAAELLATTDPVIARLLAETGPPRFPRSTESPFAALVRAITQQQIAVPAARAIHGRLITALGGEVTPERLLELPPETLRTVGLSGNKAASLRDLATKSIDGTVELTPSRLSRQRDEKIAASLMTVRGIGKWSADMFLMFQLRRLDIWPTGDLGVRKGYAVGWGVPVPTPKELDGLGEQYHPYRSVLAWYCWQAGWLAAAS